MNGNNAVQLLLIVAGLTLIPALLFTVTGFTRILVVLGFIRTGLGTPTSPPNQVLVGIALFLTIFVMAPTFSQIKKDAIDPLNHHQITQTQALKRGQEPLRQFMFKQTREKDLALFAKLAHLKQPKTRADIPTYTLIPAFIAHDWRLFAIGWVLSLVGFALGLVGITILLHFYELGGLWIMPIVVPLLGLGMAAIAVDHLGPLPAHALDGSFGEAVGARHLFPHQ